MAITVEWTFPLGIAGITEASATRKLLTPLTWSLSSTTDSESTPMRVDPTICDVGYLLLRIQSSKLSFVITDAEGDVSVCVKSDNGGCVTILLTYQISICLP